MNNLKNNISKEQYVKYAEKRATKSNIVSDSFKAFLVGGLICTFAQGLFDLYTALGIHGENVKTLVPVTLIFLAAIATGTGIFDKIAKFAGAGTLVPITGFANAVVSSAIDTKNEGWILGVGAKIFTVAGPVILYGTTAGIIYGIIIWMFSLFGIVI